MRTHTSDFKYEIKQLGREIKGKIIYYNSYDIVAENSDNILTENDLQLISENPNYDNPIEINENNIFSMSLIKNGNLLQSLMKQFNFETKDELNLGTVVNPHFGLLVDKDEQEYEYLDYGNYYIYSKEYNVDTDTWSYVCFDKMLFSMVKYKNLSNVSYPITIKEYLNVLCGKIGLDFEDTNFVNYNQLIYEDVYKDKDITYRDIFDEVSKITGSNLLINDNDNLEVAYPTETNDTIDDNYLKDINVKITKKVGPVNSVAIYDSDNNLQFIAEDINSIKQYGLTRITITDNLIALNGETQTMVNNIFNQLEGLTYYQNDFTTTGVCYYDFLDLFTTQARGESYKCLLLNNEITINQGIEEHIFTEELKEVETNTKTYTTSVMSSKDVSFKVNEQEGKIESKVEKDGVISAINQSAEEIQIEANKISLEGKEINMTSDDIVINSTNFSVDKDGNMTCNGATANNLNINDGIINLNPTTTTGPAIILNSTNAFRSINAVGTDVQSFMSPQYFLIKNKTGDYDTARLSGTTSGEIELHGPNAQILLFDETTQQVQSVEIGLYASNGLIRCTTLEQSSLESKKKNFEKLTDAKKILNETDIYKYNFKKEKDNVKKHIGFVIGDKFNYSKDITTNDNEGVDIYSMVSVLWQVVKEQQEEIDKLKEMINNG